MAFEQNGIGSIVEKKVNAYRNNPQALEKRSTKRTVDRPACPTKT